ncbi:env precursor [Jembrana disease virus]|uniref:Envelope glycoprotein n=2 Tax=Jembrana disease virus TaxID=36370 RepID=ENV_JEMBR|nr:env precursor [Jembrana disease virus]Q82857.1 RecName: Full=Envelope glycoprotein; AltName: Full=Env polyprotein; Contains: RecName: Full=Surface protein; Short=SU; AltName: Full=Glycoprotein 62; Short=gp62; Contains: RecName: Full=Transmembrane protein; Short=TM; AltName: Full=Glycoprotein 40; Short=gp40 [Jembrana disease virus]AAA64390.1 env precursor [Jembrana disease virus]prf//2116345H env gene [Jembrana disease virus]
MMEEGRKEEPEERGEKSTMRDLLQRAVDKGHLTAREALDRWTLEDHGEIHPWIILFCFAGAIGVIGGWGLRGELNVCMLIVLVVLVPIYWGIGEAARNIDSLDWKWIRKVFIVIIFVLVGLLGGCSAQRQHVAMLLSPPGIRLPSTVDIPWFCISNAPIPDCVHWTVQKPDQKHQQIENVMELQEVLDNATFFEVPDLFDRVYLELARLDANSTGVPVNIPPTGISQVKGDCSTGDIQGMNETLSTRGTLGERTFLSIRPGGWFTNTTVWFCVHWPFGFIQRKENLSEGSAQVRNCLDPINVTEPRVANYSYCPLEYKGKNYINKGLKCVGGRVDLSSNPEQHTDLLACGTFCQNFRNCDMVSRDILIGYHPSQQKQHIYINHTFWEQANTQWILVQVPNYGFVPVPDTERPWKGGKPRGKRAVGMVIFLLVLAIMAMTASVTAAATLVKQHATAQVVGRLSTNLTYITKIQNQYLHLFQNLNTRVNNLHHRVTYLEFLAEVHEVQTGLGCVPRGRYCHFDWRPEEVGLNMTLWNSTTWQQWMSYYDQIEENIWNLKYNWSEALEKGKSNTDGLEPDVFRYLADLSSSFTWGSWVDKLVWLAYILLAYFAFKVLQCIMSNLGAQTRYQLLNAQEDTDPAGDGDQPDDHRSGDTPRSGVPSGGWSQKLSEGKKIGCLILRTEWQNWRNDLRTLRWLTLGGKILQLPLSLLVLLVRILLHILSPTFQNQRGWTVGRKGTGGDDRELSPELEYLSWTGSSQEMVEMRDLKEEDIPEEGIRPVEM